MVILLRAFRTFLNCSRTLQINQTFIREYLNLHIESTDCPSLFKDDNKLLKHFFVCVNSSVLGTTVLRPRRLYRSSWRISALKDDEIAECLGISGVPTLHCREMQVFVPRGPHLILAKVHSIPSERTVGDRKDARVRLSVETF